MFILILLLSLLGWTRKKKTRNNFIGKINWYQHQARFLALEWQRWKTRLFANRSKCRNGEKVEQAGNSKPVYEFLNTGTKHLHTFLSGWQRRLPRGRSARAESWSRNSSWPERKPEDWQPQARERCVQKAETERASPVRMSTEEWGWGWAWEMNYKSAEVTMKVMECPWGNVYPGKDTIIRLDFRIIFPPAI